MILGKLLAQGDSGSCAGERIRPGTVSHMSLHYSLAVLLQPLVLGHISGLGSKGQGLCLITFCIPVTARPRKVYRKNCAEVDEPGI